MATRVFEVARELSVTSKQILAKCRAEDVELKNHMATLSAGLEATIREWFSEGAAGTAVETAEHVDLGRAREEAKKDRRRRKTAALKGEEAQTPEEAQVPQAPPAEAQVAVMEREPAVQEVSQAVAVQMEEAPVAEPPPPPVEHAPVVEKPVEPQVVQPPPVQGPSPPPVKEGIKPAGPQLVPGPPRLKGPRVVRVDKPEVGVTRRRRQPLIPEAVQVPPIPTVPPKPGKKAVSVIEEDGEALKKGKRRSPRRRGGRSADSGEKIKEWRDRDLAERSQRLAAASGGGLRRHRASVGRKIAEAPGVIRGGRVEIEEPITAKSLSAATGLKTTDILRKLMEMDVLATANQVIDREVVEALLADYDVELAVVRAKTAEEEFVDQFELRPKGPLVPRAPVVAFLGHVDHGKTSLLDRIRDTAIAAGEAGGITQHIGAYRYDVGGKHVVFLDTPGHEAFTAMRARGANMTDVVVLVVAADDGIMPQTLEAISHARAAKVPIVVALNKIDVPNANVQRVMGQLAEQGLQSREWGGTVEVIPTSAVTGAGIDALAETLSLEAELLELKAETDVPASGFVIESEIDPGRGAVARLLVRNGRLRIGDVLLAGEGYGRVRQMVDSLGRHVREAPPSTPIEVSGLDEIPQAGDRFYVVGDIEQARAVAEEHRRLARTKSLGPGKRVTLENLFSQIEAGKVKEVSLIMKADVQGSLEALVGSLKKMGTSEVKVNILHAAVGGISTGDVALAEASNAIILGFNVVPDAGARQLAEEAGVDIRLYRIIYEMIDDIRRVLEEGLAPEIREEVLGHAEIRQVFRISRVGSVAGCYVTDGLVRRNAKVRIIRNNVVVEDGRTLESLRRFKDDAREVRAGLECGLKIAGYDDIKEGDRLEFYQQVEVARRL